MHCSSCQFRKVSIVFGDVSFTTDLLVSQRKLSQCHCTMKSIKKKINFGILNNPSIAFSKIDYVLQTRLFELCFPICKKSMFQASKAVENFGNKPTTLVSKSFDPGVHQKDVRCLKNVVIDIRKPISLTISDSLNVPELLHHVDFDVSTLTIKTESIDAELFNKFCNPKSTLVVFANNDFDFDYALNLVLNSAKVKFDMELPQFWCQKLLNWDHSQNLLFCAFTKPFNPNFYLLKTFILRQKNGFVLHLNFPLENKIIYKYFEKCYPPDDNYYKACLMINNQKLSPLMKKKKFSKQIIGLIVVMVLVLYALRFFIRMI